MKRAIPILLIAAATAVLAGSFPGQDKNILAASASADTASAAPVVALPKSDPQKGRLLYVSKGCVACHAINGVGGENAAPLDAETMDPAGNPYEFFARMWLGTKPMIAMQEERMGQQVDLSAEELGDIVAFIHDAAMQKTFSNQEIPDSIEDLME